MLAVGISYDHEGFYTATLPSYVDAADSESVNTFLEKESGLVFDTILVIKNDLVIHSWLVDVASGEFNAIKGVV